MKRYGYLWLTSILIFSQFTLFGRIVFPPINNPGFYQLTDELTDPIMINSSNVTLDLGGYTVTADTGIIIATGLSNILVYNGDIVGTSYGVFANASTQNIQLNNLTIQNAICGICIPGNNNIQISQCDVSSSTTAFDIQNSYQVSLSNCTAHDTKNIAYSFISTTTSTIQNCKALNTGSNNTTIINNLVAGIYLKDGYANICKNNEINSTMALSTTDQNSIIAGIAISGSESCSQIVDNIVNSVQVAENGGTLPSGIFFKSNVDMFTTVTQYVPYPSDISKVKWSPTSQFFAISEVNISLIAYVLNIYSFDRNTKEISLCAQYQTNESFIAWHPNGRYFAMQNTGTMAIYEFDPTSYSIQEVARFSNGNITTPVIGSWDPSGKFFVTTIGASITLFTFNSINLTLSIVSSITSTITNSITDVKFSHNGLYIATCGVSGLTALIEIYSINQQSNDLALIYSTGEVNNGFYGFLNLDWSYDDSYIIIASEIDAGDGTIADFVIYKFDNPALTLQYIHSSGIVGSLGYQFRGNSVSWSPDGTYFILGTFGDLTIPFPLNYTLFLGKYDRTTNEVNTIDTTIAFDNSSLNSFTFATDWTLDGTLFSINQLQNFTGSNDFGLKIYEGLIFPSKNIVQENTVSCSPDMDSLQGNGIVTSSISNLVLDNTAYNNKNNYLMTVNIYNPLFNSAPTILQNLNLKALEGMISQPDAAQISLQNRTMLLAMRGCQPTPISSNDIISGGITISDPGFYCLTEDVTADITVSGNCITLDLNNHCVTGIISIAGCTNLILKNGFITPPRPTITATAAIDLSGFNSNQIFDSLYIYCLDTFAQNVAGQPGMNITTGNDILISNCRIRAGSAGSSSGLGVNGKDGGYGIQVSGGIRIQIKNTTITETGAGGQASGAFTGGNAGHGIFITGAAQYIEIENCLIYSTGRGGNSSSGTSGNGGNGINIGSSSINTRVYNCRIQNTGSRGSTSGTLGTSGYAIFDQRTTNNLSIIYSNFANNISNTIKYNLQNSGLESGILMPNPPTGTVINPYANVYTS